MFSRQEVGWVTLMFYFISTLIYDANEKWPYWSFSHSFNTSYSIPCYCAICVTHHHCCEWTTFPHDACLKEDFVTASSPFPSLLQVKAQRDMSLDFCFPDLKMIIKFPHYGWLTVAGRFKGYSQERLPCIMGPEEQALWYTPYTVTSFGLFVPKFKNILSKEELIRISIQLPQPY